MAFETGVLNTLKKEISLKRFIFRKFFFPIQSIQNRHVFKHSLKPTCKRAITKTFLKKKIVLNKKKSV